MVVVKQGRSQNLCAVLPFRMKYTGENAIFFPLKVDCNLNKHVKFRKKMKNNICKSIVFIFVRKTRGAPLKY